MTAETVENDYARRQSYGGPRFADLDENLCNALDDYLEERIPTQEVAEFIMDYASWKEQQEYMRWLGDVRRFVDN